MKNFQEICASYGKIITCDITQMLYESLSQPNKPYRDEIFLYIQENINNFNWYNTDLEHAIPLTWAIFYEDYMIVDYLLENAYGIDTYNRKLGHELLCMLEGKNSLDYFKELTSKRSLHPLYHIFFATHLAEKEGLHEYKSHIFNLPIFTEHLDLFIEKLTSQLSAVQMNKFMSYNYLSYEKFNHPLLEKFDFYPSWRLQYFLSDALDKKDNSFKIKKI